MSPTSATPKAWPQAKVNTPASGNRRGLLIISVTVIAAFGPYVTGGIRSEQLAVYGLGALTFLFAFSRIQMPKALTPVVLLWLCWVVIAGIQIVLPANNSTIWATGSALAGLDNLLLPMMATVLVLGLVAVGAEPLALLRRTCLVVVLAMLVNVGAAVMQYNGAEWSAWWAPVGSDGSTALNAADNGRFSGLLNQPAEAGALYSAACLCAIYLWSHRAWLLTAVLLIITVGGAMTVSKVFLLIGLPIVFWQVFRMKEKRGPRLILLALVLVAGYLAMISGRLAFWAGAQQLQALLPGEDRSVFRAATAGRLGEQATLGPVIDAVMDGSALFGFGVQGLEVQYDNGWVEALITAGLIGAVLYTLVLGAFARGFFQAPASRERLLYGGIALLAIGGAFGFSPLTANRVATVFWLLLVTLLVHFDQARRRE